MMRRARSIAVVAILAAGAIGIVSSTQTWLVVGLASGGDALLVPGAAAIPVLAPLSLAVLALGAALAIVGPAVRYVFGALAVLAAGALLWLTAPIAFEQPVTAVASTVSTATGISGTQAVSGLISTITATPWPAVALAAWMLLLAAGAFVLGTAHTWQRGGRRFSTAGPAGHASDGARLDAVDSWDDLSRGQDPT